MSERGGAGGVCWYFPVVPATRFNTCYTLTGWVNNAFASVKTSDRCVSFYDDANCRSVNIVKVTRHFKITDLDEPWDGTRKISSFIYHEYC